VGMGTAIEGSRSKVGIRDMSMIIFPTKLFRRGTGLARVIDGCRTEESKVSRVQQLALDQEMIRKER
jgi:hypothetical protein